MKNRLSTAAAVLFVLLLAVPSAAWEGRMAGVGDAGVLIEDESDYLIHPAAIASGKGFNAYGHYRVTYDAATRWDYTLIFPPGGVTIPFTASGQAWKNEGRLGAAFALGAGRMGVFFDYAGRSGVYGGDENSGGLTLPNYKLSDRSDSFALKVIYGLPVRAVKLGGEIQIAYRSEEQETFYYDINLKNYPWSAENVPFVNLYPFMIPFKSSYWEAAGKVSVGGSAGPANYAFTFRGGLPFSSENEYNCSTYGANGTVRGVNVGGDFRLRVPLSESLVLPFEVSVGYKTMKRDGDGNTPGSFLLTYAHENKDFFIKVGGGTDMQLAKDTRAAAGLYYDFIRTDQGLQIMDMGAAWFVVDQYTDMPNYSEHRLTLKALIEKEVQHTITLRGGFNVFYGLVKSSYGYFAYNEVLPSLPLNVATDGWTAGVNASIGATVKLDGVSIEPFMNAGYVKYKTSGEGTFGPMPAEESFDKINWLAGGGLSVRF
ncbi:MAG: hypothetical protein K4571_20460 [Deltaproteobacteria bacterium]